MRDRERKKKDLLCPYFGMRWIMMDEFWYPKCTEIQLSLQSEFNGRGHKCCRNNKPPHCVHSSDCANQNVSSSAYRDWYPLLCLFAQKKNTSDNVWQGNGLRLSKLWHNTQDSLLITWKRFSAIFCTLPRFCCHNLGPFFFFFLLTSSCLVSSWHFHWGE